MAASPIHHQLSTVSVFDPSEWQRLFPEASCALGSAKENMKFMKKLVAVGISTILYLRADLPDDSFTLRKLGSMELRVLSKTKDGNLASNQIIELVKNGMSALDKGYLRKLTLVVLDGEEGEHENDMRNAYEAYAFHFGSQDTDFTMTRTSKAHGKDDVSLEENMPKELTESQVIKATKTFLRNLITVTQELDVLPEVAYLSVALEYYDERTPRNYEPKGYEMSEHAPQIMVYNKAGEAQNMEHFKGIGQVDMLHQKMALRIQSKSSVLNEDDELHPSQVSLSPNPTNVDDDDAESGSYITTTSRAKAGKDKEINEAEGHQEEMDVSSDQEVELSTKEQKLKKMNAKRRRLEEELDASDLEEEQESKKKKMSVYGHTTKV